MGIESILTKQKEYDFWNTDDSNLMSDYKVDPFEQFNRDIDNAKTPHQIADIISDFADKNNRYLTNPGKCASLNAKVYSTEPENIEEARELAKEEIAQYFNFF